MLMHSVANNIKCGVLNDILKYITIQN